MTGPAFECFSDWDAMSQRGCWVKRWVGYEDVLAEGFIVEALVKWCVTGPRQLLPLYVGAADFG